MTPPFEEWYEVTVKDYNGKRKYMVLARSMSDAADKMQDDFGIPHHALVDIKIKVQEQHLFQQPQLQPQYTPPPKMPMPPGFIREWADVKVHDHCKPVGCRHEWKSDQYFSAKKYTTCTKCGAKEEDENCNF